MFDELCSIYVDAHDNCGRYVDRETGEVMQQMTIRDFCLTDRWKPVVDELRAMIERYGAKEAKARDDYRQLKTLLPGATLSGLFELREVYDEKRQRKIWCSRRTAHLKLHTGFLCIDIDAQDNQNLTDMRLILRTLRHRAEVALLMKSCSGTGYFALIPIAYPQYQKEQFKALMRDYAALGITLDKQCGDVTRIRFASYDAEPYINEAAVPYSGVDMGQQVLAPRAAVYAARSYEGETQDDVVSKVERLVQILEDNRIDITNSYGDWFKIGFSLANLPEPYGRQFFHRVSAVCDKYNPQLCDRKFNDLCHPQRIGIGTFFSICKDYGVTLRK